MIMTMTITHHFFKSNGECESTRTLTRNCREEHHQQGTGAHLLVLVIMMLLVLVIMMLVVVVMLMVLLLTMMIVMFSPDSQKNKTNVYLRKVIFSKNVKCVLRKVNESWCQCLCITFTHCCMPTMFAASCIWL